MYILVYTQYDDNESVIRFHILYASKDKSNVEEYYDSLINNPKGQYGFLNLSMYNVSDGKNDIVIGSCGY